MNRYARVYGNPVNDMESQQVMFDVLVAGNKVGEAFDVNPIFVEDDSTCKELLIRIKHELPLKDTEIALIDTCITVVSAKDDDDVLFGPGEICELGELAKTYPSHVKEILACSHHISESVDCEGDLPDGIFAGLASAHAALGDLLEAALKAGNINNYEEFEEIISDDEDHE